MRTLVLGRNPLKKGELGITLDMWPGVQRLEDMKEPWPLQSGYFDEILSDSLIEPKDVEIFFSECSRVLVDGGTLELNVKIETWQMKFAIIHNFKNIRWDDKELKLTAIK